MYLFKPDIGVVNFWPEFKAVSPLFTRAKTLNGPLAGRLILAHTQR